MQVRKLGSYTVSKIWFTATLVLSMFLSACEEGSITESQSVSFIKFYGAAGVNEGTDVKQLSDGGYVICGVATVPGNGEDIAVIRTDKYGNETWFKTFGNKNADRAYSVQVCANGDVVVAATVTDTAVASNSLKDILLLRLNTAGDTVWTRKIGGSKNEELYYILPLRDGGFVGAGYTESSGNGGKDGYIAYFSEDGKFENEIVQGGTGNDFLKSCIETNDGILAVGSYGSQFVKGLSDIYFLVVDKDRVTESSDYIGTAANENGLLVLRNADSSYTALASSTDANQSVVMYSFNIQEYDLKNKTAKNIGATAGFIPATMIIDNAGGLVVGGTVDAGSGNSDMQLHKINTGNQLTNSFNFGGSSAQRSNQIIQAADNGYVFTGTNELSGNSVIVLLKVLNNGALQ